MSYNYESRNYNFQKDINLFIVLFGSSYITSNVKNKYNNHIILDI